MELNNNESIEDIEPDDEPDYETDEPIDDKTIAYKNNLNDSNNIDSNDLIKLCKIIDSLESSHHIEIAKILKTSNVYLNENSNGIFVNLNKISSTVYKTICNYIEFIKKQENDINKDEKLKRTLQTIYFKDNKDIATTNTSN
jgi:DNA-binding transcriptional regulator WhiA